MTRTVRPGDHCVSIQDWALPERHPHLRSCEDFPAGRGNRISRVSIKRQSSQEGKTRNLKPCKHPPPTDQPRWCKIPSPSPPSRAFRKTASDGSPTMFQNPGKSRGDYEAVPGRAAGLPRPESAISTDPFSRPYDTALSSNSGFRPITTGTSIHAQHWPLLMAPYSARR